MTNVISAKSLFKTYGQKRALDDFNLEVKKGSIFGLLGPNGAGKTTAIEIMLGLNTADAGEIEVLGINPQHKFLEIADRVGAMLQQGGINPGIKPREALNLYSSFYSNSRNVDELLDLVNLTGIDQPLRRLSGGQAQSLSLALAIIANPELVFLDEPTVGMDPMARRNTWEIIKNLNETGTTVVLTTHLMDEAEMLCDDIAIISSGKVIAQGNTEELTMVKNGFVEVEFAKPVSSDELTDILNVECTNLTEYKIRVLAQANEETIYLIARFARDNSNIIKQLSTQSRSLEEVFIELTNEEMIKSE